MRDVTAGLSRRKLTTAVAGVLLALLATLGVVSVSPTSAEAADLSQFRPGNIISDSVFFNENTMSEAQIQAFLNAKVSKCAAGYSCLKDHSQATTTRAADAMCQGYAGAANESAARIIFKVAQSCGVNPQVILVMLQKEQGLVLDSTPSSWAWTASMGYACPDTAACDTRYYGFFNQVYMGMWQLKRYGNPPGTSNYFTWFPIGKAAPIRYSPNASCGSGNVVVENKATAALYYYTPYQPNAAALAAGYGASGDPCSAYGNRNFYNYFTDWFGSTVGTDGAAAIAAEYGAQGAEAGLGAPTSDVLTITSNGGGLGRAYQRGSIYWTAATGAKTVRSGAYLDYYFARGGASGSLGWPTSNAMPVSQNGGGFGQAFTSGSVYSSANGTFLVSGAVRDTYFSENGAAGTIAWPIGEVQCGLPDKGCAQPFQNASIYTSAFGGFVVRAPILNAYHASGGPSGWGMPTTASMPVAGNGGGVGQVFAAGSAFARSGGAAFLVTGTIRDFYFGRGGANGDLGWPIGAQSCVAGGECTQAFQSGTVIATPGQALRVGSPEIDAAHAALGGATGKYGAVSSGLLKIADNGGGLAQVYANGSIYWSSATGAFGVTGAIRSAYFAQGGASGALGWPTSAENCSTGTRCVQSFQNGAIHLVGTSAFTVAGNIRTAYDAAGGSTGSWGDPQSGLLRLTAHGGGTAQVFSKGSAYAAAGAGAYFVTGAIRDQYFARGGADGALGWPTGAMTCGLPSSGCSQAFQGGTVFTSPTLGSQVVSGSVLTAYSAAGGPAGSWGWPVGALLPITGGSGQVFWAGSAFAAAGSSAYFVSGGIRDFYFSQGGAVGSLGWPTGAMACAADTKVCTQSFAGGTVSWSPNGGARLL